MGFYYSSILDKKSIVDLAEKYGFANHQYVEKYIMCFEAHHRIAQEIDCTVRGGMCMPFHQPGFEVRRMSVDVDIISSRTTDEMRQAVDRIGGRGLRPTKITPINPHPLDNLVSYKIGYDSCFGRESYVKVDAFCNANPNVTFQQIPSGTKIMDFVTLQKISMLSKGSLLADKCTALAVGTIGIRADRQAEMVKQVYDIAALLRSATLDDLAAAYESYMRLTEIKVECFKHDPPYTVHGVASSIIQTLESYLDFRSTITITKDHTRRYEDFNSTYVSKKSPYKKVDHAANVLLAYLFCLTLQRYIKSITPACDRHSLKTRVACFMYKTLEELQDLPASKEEQRAAREEYKQGVSDGFISKKNLKAARLDLVFLAKAISSASRCNNYSDRA